MAGCPRCGDEIEERFRYCPSCGTPQRRKLVELFPAALARDGARALRVSRYLGDDAAGRHVRFSVWSPDGVAEGVLSLSEDESARLARFLLEQPAGAGAAGPAPARDEEPTLPLPRVADR